jgi:hypothetical protein
VKTHIPFRFLLFSEVSVPSLSELTGIDFYRPSEIGPSLDDVGEIPILKWLVRRPDLMQLILGQLGFRGRVCLDVEVTKPFQPRHRAGDIDLLAVPERDPRLAVAFQAKRFKARLSDHGDDISLDGAKLDRLIDQCNQTLKLGFRQVYGLVLVMIAGHRNSAASILHHGTSDNTFRRLYQFTRNVSLDWRVGIVFVEIVQPTAASFNKLGLVSVGVDKIAHPVGQAGAFSSLVERWANEMSRKRGVCQIELPPLQGEPILARPDEAIGLRLVRRN